LVSDPTISGINYDFASEFNSLSLLFDWQQSGGAFSSEVEPVSTTKSRLQVNSTAAEHTEIMPNLRSWHIWYPSAGMTFISFATYGGCPCHGSTCYYTHGISRIMSSLAGKTIALKRLPEFLDKIQNRAECVHRKKQMVSCGFNGYSYHCITRNQQGVFYNEAPYS